MSVTIERGDGLIRIANSAVILEIATAFGPRIMSYRLPDSPNVFVSLPDARLDWRPGRPFRMHGGHRLWLAPEERDFTYVPDDAPVEVSEAEGVLTVAAVAAEDSPFAKSIALHLDPVTSAVTVTHFVRNEGTAPARVAPWAITMLRPEGAVLLPLREGNAGGLQADRSIVVWPYTRLADPAIQIDDEAVVIRGNRSDPTKIGTHGSVGWGAYVVDGLVFTKSAPFDPNAVYADRGAAVQCYATDRFCELETLGPLTELRPGAAVHHVERWALQPVDALDADSHLAGQIRRAGLA